MRWRPVAGYPGYEVSESGSVRGPRGVLAKTPNDGGYLRVKLAIGDQRRNVLVHLIVLRAFVGPAPSARHHGAHGNGDRRDNRLENLAWKTPEENEADKHAAGTAPAGFSGHRRTDVAQVRRLLSEGLSYARVGLRIGLHRSSVSRIARGLRHRADDGVSAQNGRSTPACSSTSRARS